MSKPRYVGHALTRRVKLVEGERILRSANAARLGFLGFASPGLLTLSSRRLIWTPTPVPWDPVHWIADRTDIKVVTVKPRRWWQPPWLSALHVEANGSTRNFGLDAWPIFWRTSGWAKAIRKWANI